ncbi:aminoglycoside phosphotransferase [Amycolatopsis mediterranei S699]|uniref:Aminoglycoside phosphotransferase n=2 Tax=Amycolatopsis mediterranei TaxID=33910 RepID=A0A0H3DF96_AMYMU|nr:phosphotransferase family protein [Amycolatopsis mediterranei]ADJ48887.1 aminoglycoside phosphotransferase [Amycolatopsis mediterranei U32]AEK45835.1 aminoglycoside phosphotransferase [Amycolatopsis mediterranei S699]AFO80595.1 aminoglycoside phosphotransferase [Amycolatopsis mediterranei S699]AGT87723.1 aminoglycoside phosphotransferase [Amycolatopsis mediterranei RB]KDU93996.1 aminoglycoside phosphotransferase [Amycolatopsis mediterranei]
MVDGSPAARTKVGIADRADVVRRATNAAGQPLHQLEPLPGGTSSLTYSAVTDSGVRVVVKVAPPGLEPVRNRDVLRQARVLTALSEVPEVAVPEVLGSDPGAPPDVPPLFVMSYADGESYEPRHIARARRPPAADVRGRATAAARMLAALHTADPAKLGITEEAVTLETEVERWRKALATCALEPAAARAELECREQLTAAIPAPLRPAVLHGDWRLGNMQCDGAGIRAVIDWEIWSIGDPRLDLAWLRLMSDPAHPTAVAPEAPTLEPGELLAAYGSPVADLAWFDALVRYKQAAASALLVKNAERRDQVTDRVERMRRGIPLLLTAALTHLTRR